jgi:3-hydroxyacyl-CoA dehydrogenase
MAAHYRVANPTSKLGLPEVKLGLIPGAGGTQRLPRLVGVEHAIEMCAKGDPVPAMEAARRGLIDEIIEGDLLKGALRFAKAAQNQPIPRTRERSDRLSSPEASAILFEVARQNLRAAARPLPAPEGAIEAVEAALIWPFEEGCRIERGIFERLLQSDEAKALLHVFFAERATGKVRGWSKDAAAKPIAHAAVIGAGTMGRGIAMCLANAGILVRLKEANQELLDSAMAAISSVYQSAVAKGRLIGAEKELRLSSVYPQLDFAGFEEVDLVIEAAFEDLEVKERIFQEVDLLVRSDAVLATNTSYLNIDAIAAASSRPEMVLGLHFFSPAHIMRLLEIVPGAATSKEVLSTGIELAKRLGKLGVVAGNCTGFIGNRMWRVYRNEAQLLVEEGASPQEIDDALTDFGMAMGPLAVQDLVGIDISVSSVPLFAHLDRPGFRRPRVMEKLFTAGRLGRKTRAGWYQYDERGNRQADAAVERLILAASAEAGIQRRQISPPEIVKRAMLAIINEGARILEEGFARRASDIDVVLINGYGFPGFRGGPMHYADHLGLNTICEQMHELRGIYGESWRPAPLLTKLAESKQSFSDWDREQAL